MSRRAIKLFSRGSLARPFWWLQMSLQLEGVSGALFLGPLLVHGGVKLASLRTLVSQQFPVQIGVLLVSEHPKEFLPHEGDRCVLVSPLNVVQQTVKVRQSKLTNQNFIDLIKLRCFLIHQHHLLEDKL